MALDAPAGTVTLGGTVATVVSWLESATTRPPAGAAPLSVTVPVELSPPITVAGLSESASSEPGARRSSVSPSDQLRLAQTVTERRDSTGLVVTVKSALVERAGELVDELVAAEA